MINSIKKIKDLALSAAKGFTLIETLVAVLLLSIAIAGPLTIASKALSTALIAKDQIGAYYLAQDAIEYLRYARDSNCLAAGGTTGCPSGSWLNGTVNLTPCENSSGCYLDSIHSTVGLMTSCPTTGCVLNWDSTNHYYSYTTGTASPEHYIRTVKMTAPVGSNDCSAGKGCEAGVVVIVQWTGAGGITHSITLREDLFNWE